MSKIEIKSIDDLNIDIINYPGVMSSQLCFVDDNPKYLIVDYCDEHPEECCDDWGTLILNLDKKDDDGYEYLIYSCWFKEEELIEMFQKEDFWPKEEKYIFSGLSLNIELSEIISKYLIN